MSYLPQTCVVVGYRLPKEASPYIYELIEDDYDILGRYEDFIVDPDDIRDTGDIFFGKIILELDDHCEPMRFDDIRFTQKDYDEVSKGFNDLHLSKWCAEHNCSPRFDKWIMVRWV